jgi:hypothetical protein
MALIIAVILDTQKIQNTETKSEITINTDKNIKNMTYLSLLTLTLAQPLTLRNNNRSGEVYLVKHYVIVCP